MRPAPRWLIGCVIPCALGFTTPVFPEPLTITVIDEATDAPVENAVVTLPGQGKPAQGTFTVAQKNRSFQPGVLVIPEGSEVNFPNRDNTQHHVYSFSPAKTFNIELYAGNPESPIHFDQSGIVELGCNIHDHMQGFILVTQRPHYALTDADGRVQFDIAPGTDRQSVSANVWHRRLPDPDRYNQQTLEPNTRSPMRIHIPLEPEPEEDDELDQLQQEFEDL